jgi:hypothetical protein
MLDVSRVQNARASTALAGFTASGAAPASRGSRTNRVPTIRRTARVGSGGPAPTMTLAQYSASIARLV